ncbi:MAG: hypothetical protein ACE5EH_06540 [Gammaproteobacteria bacterium]
MIACYVSGKGMNATERTWSFKVSVIELLENSGIGYDTRFKYYQSQYPSLGILELARKICEPVEYYDKDWEHYLAQQADIPPDPMKLVEFWLARDLKFQQEARVAIVCFDEAGLGTGVNMMRFIGQKKSVLGFYHRDKSRRKVNITNVLQLEYKYPDQVELSDYESNAEITDRVLSWLSSR